MADGDEVGHVRRRRHELEPRAAVDGALREAVVFCLRRVGEVGGAEDRRLVHEGAKVRAPVGEGRRAARRRRGDELVVRHEVRVGVLEHSDLRLAARDRRELGAEAVGAVEVVVVPVDDRRRAALLEAVGREAALLADRDDRVEDDVLDREAEVRLLAGLELADAEVRRRVVDDRDRDELVLRVRLLRDLEERVRHELGARVGRDHDADRRQRVVGHRKDVGLVHRDGAAVVLDGNGEGAGR